MHARREPFPVRLLRGEADGLSARFLSFLLSPASWLFASGAEVRRALYQAGVMTRHRVPTPVVSIGNLTVGGTGKTPLVEWIVREIRLLGVRPVVLSRGYGAVGEEVPDEICALLENLPELPFVRDADRVRGALTAIERHGAQAVVLDDGFQHLRLARDLDLVTVDATRPFGGGHCLPRGALREPVRSLRRADAVVVTRTDLVSPGDTVGIREKIRRVAPDLVVATAAHRPTGLLRLPEREEGGIGDLEGSRVFAVSGIGNPAAFERTLEELGATLAGRRRFRDHHRYDSADLLGIARDAARAGADRVVTTQKDAVKWKEPLPDGLPAFALLVRLELRTGVEEIRRLLRAALRGALAAG